MLSENGDVIKIDTTVDRRYHVASFLIGVVV